jgi:hypothetical protein
MAAITAKGSTRGRILRRGSLMCDRPEVKTVSPGSAVIPVPAGGRPQRRAVAYGWIPACAGILQNAPFGRVGGMNDVSRTMDGPLSHRRALRNISNRHGVPSPQRRTLVVRQKSSRPGEGSRHRRVGEGDDGAAGSEVSGTHSPSPGRRFASPALSLQGRGRVVLWRVDAVHPHGSALSPRGRGRRGAAEPGEGAFAEVSHERGGWGLPLMLSPRFRGSAIACAGYSTG